VLSWLVVLVKLEADFGEIWGIVGVKNSIRNANNCGIGPERERLALAIIILYGS
jgi:hypothetical protein